MVSWALLFLGLPDFLRKNTRAQSCSNPNAALVGLWLVKTDPVACFARNKH